MPGNEEEAAACLDAYLHTLAPAFVRQSFASKREINGLPRTSLDWESSA
jgi:hypothetical protein